MDILIFAAAQGEGEGLSITPKVIYDFGHGIVITDTMISVWFTTVILLTVALIVRFVLIPKWRTKKEPGYLQLLLEGTIDGMSSTSSELCGHYEKNITPHFFAVAAFMALGVLIELLGFRPILTDLNVALVLSFATFFMIHYYGFRRHKARRLFHFINPINIITDSVVPFSMSIRMFGSVLSGYFIMHLLYGLPIYAHFIIPAIASLMFTVFHAVIQTYVFYMLSLCFISEAAE